MRGRNGLSRRVADIAVATLVLLVTAPITTAAALAVRLSSPGPVLYRAARAGRGGATFSMLKFRTMRADADRVGPPITGAADPRVTAVGRFLRRTKIDELPEFINVLRGDMTLVGPRPEDPAVVARYTPRQKEILAIKPGVTGPSQLYYGGEEAEAIPPGAHPLEYYLAHLLEPKIERDLAYYFGTRTARGDARIVLQTIGYVLGAWRPGPAVRPRDAK